MDRKVGDSFWSAQEGGEKQTNKKASNLLELNIFGIKMLKIQLLIKKNAIKSKICFSQPATTFQSVGDKCPTTSLVSMECI
jgi:hypothetical protein